MPLVEIYKLQNNGDQKVIVKCTLNAGSVLCEGDPVFVENLNKTGIRDYSDSSGAKKLFPKDGRKFLENLKYAFKSAYLSATDVEE